MDIDALNTSDISVTAADQTLTLATTGAGTSKLILSSAGTGADAIEINATAGGVTAKVVDEKNLVLGNAEGNAYFKVAASNDAANEIVEIKNTSNAKIKKLQIFNTLKIFCTHLPRMTPK